MAVKVWIFQGNPDLFDIDAYLRAGLEEISWSVKQHRKEIKPGDLVYVWKAAGQRTRGVSGVVASAVVTSLPYEGPDHEASLPFWKRPEDAAVVEGRVWLRVERVATSREVIKRSWLQDDPVCQGVSILANPRGTNFRVTEQEAARLAQLWAHSGQSWTWGESLAALWLYQQLLGQPISKKPGSPVADLAVRMGRAVSSVYNKVLNFRAIDPRDDRAGMSGAAQVDHEVWDAFYDAESERLRVDALQEDFDRLWGAPRLAARGRLVPKTEYREADESLCPAEARPSRPDPDLMAAGWRVHARTQNELAHAVREAGLEPLSPGDKEPLFDLGWWSGGVFFVAEIKSITRQNEEEQLRLGLGQVLRYRHFLPEGTVAVLAASQMPAEFSSWRETCADVGVRLVWPKVWSSLWS